MFEKYKVRHCKQCNKPYTRAERKLTNKPKYCSKSCASTGRLAGRKPMIDKDVMQQLKAAYSLGYTDEEACIYCGIGSVKTLYRFFKKNQQFKDEVRLIQKSPNLVVKTNIVAEINSQEYEKNREGIEVKNKFFDYDRRLKTSLRRAKYKMSDEFATRQKTTGLVADLSDSLSEEHKEVLRAQLLANNLVDEEERDQFYGDEDSDEDFEE